MEEPTHTTTTSVACHIGKHRLCTGRMNVTNHVGGKTETCECPCHEHDDDDDDDDEIIPGESPDPNWMNP